MILTKYNIVLVDNEICFTSNRKPQLGDIVFLNNSIDGLPEYDGYHLISISDETLMSAATSLNCPVITHSTNHSLEGVKHLDRNLFVKKVDVEAREYALAQGENARNYAVAHDFISGRGKYEFTKEEMKRGMLCAASWVFEGGNVFAIEEYIRGFFAGIRPLSIPESIELDDEFNVVNVKW